MVPEVTYCGYVINGRGIKPVEAKVEAIQNAPVPENVTQLRAFLGMLNYYHRFLPDIATVLEPLHKLLRQCTNWVLEDRAAGGLRRIQETSSVCKPPGAFPARSGTDLGE